MNVHVSVQETRRLYHQLLVRVVAILLLFLNGCGNGAQSDGPDYPPILPTYMLQEHPTEVGGDAVPASKVVEYDTALVIPLYENLTLAGNRHSYVILNPFTIKSTEDLETELAKRGHRDEVVRVILWVPGFLPVAIPKRFRPEMVIAGKRMTLVEAHIENLDNGSPVRMAKALNWLLSQDHFLLGGYVDTRRQYDARSLVTAVEYGSQYSMKATLRGVKGTYVLWAFDPKTKIDIVMDEVTKKEVLEFLGKHAVAGNSDKQSPCTGPASQ